MILFWLTIAMSPESRQWSEPEYRRDAKRKILEYKTRKKYFGVFSWLLLVSDTEQMTVEIVQIGALMSASIASPWVRIRVKSFVEEIQGLVRIWDVTVGTRVHVWWWGRWLRWHVAVTRWWLSSVTQTWTLGGLWVSGNCWRFCSWRSWSRTEGRGSSEDRRVGDVTAEAEVLHLTVVILGHGENSTVAVLFDREQASLRRLLAARDVTWRHVTLTVGRNRKWRTGPGHVGHVDVGTGGKIRRVFVVTTSRPQGSLQHRIFGGRKSWWILHQTLGRIVKINVVSSPQMVPNMVQAGGSDSAQLAWPLSWWRGWPDVFVLEVRVHCNVSLEPFLTSRTHEGERFHWPRSPFLFLYFYRNHMDLLGSGTGRRIITVSDPISSLLSELL